jgi:hypothetical protein
MTENAFTQAEAALVDKIVAWLGENPKANEDEKRGMITHFAYANTRSYAGNDDYLAASEAVIQLVKERINNQTTKENL